MIVSEVRYRFITDKTPTRHLERGHFPQRGDIMFHDIPPEVQERMNYLESIDARDRQDGTPHSHRLRQITPDTGPFIALMAAMAPEGVYLEIGTSAGYSTLWLALACRELGRVITTFELAEHKADVARETFASAGVEEVVRLVFGDALEYLVAYEGIAFCFLDADKDDYNRFYDAVVPRMISGGILVADNVISHEEIVRPMLERALSDERVDATIVPVGRGQLLCRKK